MAARHASACPRTGRPGDQRRDADDGSSGAAQRIAHPGHAEDDADRHDRVARRQQHDVGPPDRVEHARARRSRGRARPRRTGCAGTAAWWRTHHSWKWIARSPPSSSSTTTWVSTGTSVIGSSSMPPLREPPAGRQPRGHLAERGSPGPSHCERTTWVPMSRSPRANHCGTRAVGGELALHAVALVGAAPALPLVDAAAERVEEGVDVGADAQAEQGDVVTGVRDDGDRRVRESGRACRGGGAGRGRSGRRRPRRRGP